MHKTIALLLCLLSVTTTPCQAENNDWNNPLQPADTGSPRSTLKGFITTLNESHARLMAILKDYLAAPGLYTTDEQEAAVDYAMTKVQLAKRALDLSDLPAALADQIAAYRILQLKEILDRLELPPIDSVPDAAAMEDKEFKSWTIPDTELTIARVEDGPRAGEYLFTPGTVAKLPQFYTSVKHLPYKPGATENWYETYRYGGAGVRDFIPLKWMMNLPPWMTQRFIDQPVWRWIGVFVVIGFSVLILSLIKRLVTAGIRNESTSELQRSWLQLVIPLTLLALIPFVVWLLESNLRISGHVLRVMALTLWAIFTLNLTWTVWLTSNVIAETIVSSQELHHGSIDSQLVRLGLRLIAMILSIAVLVIGAQQLGIPAYSVVAGLGVGGIAVALAARDSLANLLGSLLIMFEKPFRVGHWIKVQGTEGIVESIGFRSTRIRTFYDSLVSIPSNQLVNSTVDNMAMRSHRAVRTFLRLRYDTPEEKIEPFIDAVRELIRSNEYTLERRLQVALDDFGEHGIHILVNFLFDVPDMQTEKRERQRLFLAILKLAEDQGIEFAVPVKIPETPPDIANPVS